MILKIKELRKQKGMTLEELSKKSGVSRRMISAYEANESDITLKKMHQIAQALEVTITDLIGIEIVNVVNEPDGVFVRMSDKSADFLQQRIEDLQLIIHEKEKVIRLLELQTELKKNIG